MYKRFIYTSLQVPQLAFATDVFLFCLRCGPTDKLLTVETFGIPRMIFLQAGYILQFTVRAVKALQACMSNNRSTKHLFLRICWYCEFYKSVCFCSI